MCVRQPSPPPPTPTLLVLVVVVYQLVIVPRGWPWWYSLLRARRRQWVVVLRARGVEHWVVAVLHWCFY